MAKKVLRKPKKSAEAVTKPKRKIIRRKSSKPTNVVFLNEWLYAQVTRDKVMNEELEGYRELGLFLGNHNTWGYDVCTLRNIYMENKWSNSVPNKQKQGQLVIMEV